MVSVSFARTSIDLFRTVLRITKSNSNISGRLLATTCSLGKQDGCCFSYALSRFVGLVIVRPDDFGVVAPEDINDVLALNLIAISKVLKTTFMLSEEVSVRKRLVFTSIV